MDLKRPEVHQLMAQEGLKLCSRAAALVLLVLQVAKVS
jgi:hypothetical protein